MIKQMSIKRMLLCLVLVPCAFIGLFANCSNAKANNPIVSFKQVPGKLSISIDGQPFATYVYEDQEITRPYFAHVKSPCGIQVTRNHPPKPDDPQDHSTYHPGIWMSFGDINGNDYWRMKTKVEHEMFVEQPKGGPGKGTFTVRNFYLGPDGNDRVLAEVVKYTVLVEPAGYLLVWESTFSSDSNDFIFGDQEEMGLGVRVNTKISVQYGQGHITNAEGLRDGNEVWGKASDWIDYGGNIDDNYVGMAILPDVKNFRPSWYHARDYGYVAANPFGREAMKQGEKSAITVKQGEELHLGFGILIYCNPKDEKPDINTSYQEYLEIIEKSDE